MLLALKSGNFGCVEPSFNALKANALNFEQACSARAAEALRHGH